MSDGRSGGFSCAHARKVTALSPAQHAAASNAAPRIDCFFMFESTGSTDLISNLQLQCEFFSKKGSCRIVHEKPFPSTDQAVSAGIGTLTTRKLNMLQRLRALTKALRSGHRRRRAVSAAPTVCSVDRQKGDGILVFHENPLACRDRVSVRLTACHFDSCNLGVSLAVWLENEEFGRWSQS